MDGILPAKALRAELGRDAPAPWRLRITEAGRWFAHGPARVHDATRWAAVRLTWSSWLAVLAVMLALAPQGAAQAATGAGTEATENADAWARVEGFYRQLDELRQKVTARTTTADTQREIGEITKSIVREILGTPLSATYDQYEQRLADLKKQEDETGRDTNLDQPAKRTRLGEIARQRAALDAEYAEAIDAHQAAETEVSQRADRQKALGMLKTLLKPTDQEWEVLQPKLDYIVRLENRLRQLERPERQPKGGAPLTVSLTGGKMEFVPQASTPEGAVMEAVKASPVDAGAVKGKVEALRQARAAVAARNAKNTEQLTRKLKAAREDIRSILTVKQESGLVLEGILD